MGTTGSMVKKVRRRHFSRGRFILGVLFCLAAISFAVWSALELAKRVTADDAMPVKSLVIDGALQELTQSEIAAVVDRYCSGHNLAVLDLVPVHNALVKLPWAAEAAVKKQLPDTIVVSIIEHVPAAYWNDNGLYDARLRQVFYPDLSRFRQPLVRLGAEHDNLAPEVYDEAVRLMRELRGSAYQLVELRLDQVGCWRLRLSNGLWIILGRDHQGSQTVMRLRRFLKAFPLTGADPQSVEYVDLRYESGFAVGPQRQETADKSGK